MKQEQIEVGDWVQDLCPTEPEVCGRGFVIWMDNDKGRWGIWWEDPSGFDLDGWNPSPEDMKRMIGNGTEPLPLVWDQPICSSLIKVAKNRAYDEFKRGEYVSTSDQEHPKGIVRFQRWRLVAVTKGFDTKWTNYFRVEDLKKMEGMEKWFCRLRKYYHDKSWFYWAWKIRRGKGFKRNERWKTFTVPKYPLRNPFIPFWFWKLVIRKEEKIEQTT